MSLWVIVLGLLADGIVAVGDWYARRWVNVNILNYQLLIAMFCYFSVTGLWMVVLRMVGELGRAGIFWSCTGTVVPILLGHFVFHEPMPWNMQLAVVLCVLGTALAAWR